MALTTALVVSEREIEGFPCVNLLHNSSLLPDSTPPLTELHELKYGRKALRRARSWLFWHSSFVTRFVDPVELPYSYFW